MDAPDRGTILVMCTGNINRSPLAAELLRRKLGRGYTIASGGLAAAGVSPPRQMLKAAARHDVDLRNHRSRTLVAQDIQNAELVLCMDNSHPRALEGLDAQAHTKTFTLREAVTRFSSVRPKGTLAERVAELTAGRTIEEFLWPQFGEIADPMGGGRSAFAAAADQIASCVENLGNRILFD